MGKRMNFIKVELREWYEENSIFIILFIFVGLIFVSLLLVTEFGLVGILPAIVVYTGFFVILICDWYEGLVERFENFEGDN